MADDLMGKVNVSAIGQNQARLEGLTKASESVGKDSKDAKKIRQLAEDFEAVFLETMVAAMRKTVDKSGLIDGGNAEEIYRSMLDSEYAKLMSAQRSTGLANAIEGYMLGTQRGSAPAANPKVPTTPGLQGIGKQARISTK